MNDSIAAVMSNFAAIQKEVAPKVVEFCEQQKGIQNAFEQHYPKLCFKFDDDDHYVNLDENWNLVTFGSKSWVAVCHIDDYSRRDLIVDFLEGRGYFE